MTAVGEAASTSVHPEGHTEVAAENSDESREVFRNSENMAQRLASRGICVMPFAMSMNSPDTGRCMVMCRRQSDI